MRILNVPERFSQRWIETNVPGMESTEFHATFHEAATRGWSEDELRRLAKMWGNSQPESADGLMEPTTPIDKSEPVVPEAPAEGGDGAS